MRYTHVPHDRIYTIYITNMYNDMVNNTYITSIIHTSILYTILTNNNYLHSFNTHKTIFKFQMLNGNKYI